MKIIRVNSTQTIVVRSMKSIETLFEVNGVKTIKFSGYLISTTDSDTKIMSVRRFTTNADRWEIVEDNILNINAE